MRQYAVDYLNVHDLGNDVPRSYGATGIPETYFISARGRVVDHVIGAISPRELRDGITIAMSQNDPTTAQRRRNQIVLLAVSISLLVVVVGLLGRSAATTGRVGQISNPGSQFAGPVFPAHFRAAFFSLSDQDGKRVTLTEYRGQVVVLSFMHSHCKDTCPVMATEIRGALDQLPDHGRNVPVLAISVDPFHDTRASARAFIAREHMTGRMRFLLGPYRQLRPIWKAYAIQPEVDQSGREYSHGHSAYVMLIDRHGVLRVGFPAGQLVPEDLAHDLKLLLARSG
jgi:protein SCO1/2